MILLPLLFDVCRNQIDILNIKITLLEMDTRQSVESKAFGGYGFMYQSEMIDILPPQCTVY